MDSLELKEMARKIRLDTIDMIHRVKSGHPGGALSIADILAVLYFDELHIDPQKPTWQERDRFILSKGHACTSLYAALAQRGFFPREELWSLRQYKSILQGHPDMKVTPGLDMSSGSLGQGLSIANGMALAGKLQNKDYRVYTILGDGELQEGQIWEAAMSAVQYELDNLVAFVDDNNLQINGTTDDVMRVKPITGKFENFGWNVLSVDGHDIVAIKDALKAARQTKGVPTMIIAETVKGKGVSFMENKAKWHSGILSQEEYHKAVLELGGEV